MFSNFTTCIYSSHNNLEWYSSSKLFVVMYMYLNFNHPKDEEPKRIWTNNSPNSHFSLKPLALILEKESKDLATALYKLYVTVNGLNFLAYARNFEKGYVGYFYVWTLFIILSIA